MEEKQKIVCPYCGSDDFYRNKAGGVKSIFAMILSMFIGTRSFGMPVVPPRKIEEPYHCFNCGKDFKKGKVIKE